MEFLTNVCHLDNYNSGRGLHLQVKSHKILVGIQEDDILHLTSFPEIPSFLFYLFSCSPRFIITCRGLPGLELATTISGFFLIACTIDFKLKKFLSQIHLV